MGYTPDNDDRPPLPSQRPDNYTTPIKLTASKIENVDAAMIDFVKDLKLSANKSAGFEEVPIIWVSPERAFSSKRDQLYRDADGTLIYPIISVERSSVRKDLTVKGTVWANIMPVKDEKGGSIQVARRIKQDKTSNFQNAHAKRKRGQLNFPTAKNKRIVYETVSMPIPVYVEITYKIILRSEYQQQMNELITPFITKPGGVNYIILKKDGHTYEGFIQPDYRQNNNFRSFTREERKLETEIEIKVLAYLIGQGRNQDQPTYVVRENAVEVKIPRERIIFNDKPEHTGGRYYGLAGIIKPRKGKREEFFPPFDTAGVGGGTGPGASNTSAGGGGGREYTAGSGITLNGSEFSVDTSIVAVRSGTTFTGAVTFDAGITGSLTKLRDGSAYLVAGGNITLATGSNGAISISSTATGDGSGFLARYKVRQTFSESPNGSRVAFTAPSNYVEGSEMVFRDGMLMMSGSANDYVLTPPNKITFNSEDPPDSDEVLLITYVQS